MKTNSSTRRVSMRDIAKQMGVSHMTVSMALRNQSRVSEKVRLRAEELGYRPDPMLAALSCYRQAKACHLVTADQIANSILAFEEIRKRGYRVIGFVTDESELTQDRHRFECGKGIPPILRQILVEGNWVDGASLPRRN